MWRACATSSSGWPSASPRWWCRCRAGPGQREDRFAHLLCGPVDMEAIVARDAHAAGESPAPALAARVSALEAEVAELREQVERLLDATKG